MDKEINDICKAIKPSKNVMLLAHKDPDGDAIGSMIALNILLKKLGKNTVMYCPDEVPHIYSFLPHSGEVRTNISPNEAFDLAIAVDCGDMHRFGTSIDIKRTAKVLVNIDHHPDNTKFGDINCIKNISSVAEIIYGLFDALQIKIDKNVASCLYVGIMTDTGSFRYDYTSSETFRIAADLKDKGADTSRIAMTVYETKTIPSMKILGAAMYRLESSEKGTVVWTALSKKLMNDIGAKSEDLTGIVDQLRSIKGAELAILFREENGVIKINFRSKHKVNCSDIAKKLGGGGHIRASGVVIQGGLEEVKEKVLKEVFKSVK